MLEDIKNDPPDTAKIIPISCVVRSRFRRCRLGNAGVSGCQIGNAGVSGVVGSGADGDNSFMSSIRIKGRLEGNMVIWDLEGHQIEFTLDEFRELMDGLGKSRLFSVLERVRPTLKSQLVALFSDRYSLDDEKELEYLLEQCLFGLERKVRI